MSVFRVVKDREVSKKNSVDYAQDRGRKFRRNVGACISIYIYIYIYMCVCVCVCVCVCHKVCLHQHFCSEPELSQ